MNNNLLNTQLKEVQDKSGVSNIIYFSTLTDFFFYYFKKNVELNLVSTLF